MADNTTLNAGSGGDTLASDDIGGVKYPRSKISLGADGAASDAIPVAAAMDSAGTGIQAVGILGQFDDTSTAAVTENQFAPLRVDSARKLLVVADLSATDNAVLDDIASDTEAIKTAVEILDNVVSGSEMQVDIVSSALPTGAATAANQTTIIGHVDGIETLLGTIDADTSALAGAVSGSEMQVDVVAALPAGTNNIGDVDVLSVVPGTGATNLGKAEDAAHSTGDVGVMALAVRQSSQSDFGADGDYVPLSIDDDGGLRVSIVAGAGSGGTAAADDADFVAGTTSGTPAMGVYESSPSSVTDGDLGAVGITQTRQLRTAAAQEGTWNVTNVSGTVSLPTGAATAANQSTVIGHLDGVEGLLGTIDADTGSILTAAQLIDNPIVAHDAAISGSSGVNVAGFNARSTDPTAVASADATQGLATLLGKQVVYPHAIPAASWAYAGPSGGITDTSEDTVLAAPGAGVRAYLTSLQIINADATVATAVSILDGSGGTVLWRGYAAAVGGGISAQFPVPIRFTANTAIIVVCATTSSETYVNAQGFTAAE